MARVYVGMSGGVDSSVTAALLKEQGHDVTGVYMKNWSKDLPGFDCPWREDYQDAKRVAVQLGIDFKLYDFESQYRDQVVQYMLDGYRSGITPNPDIMCNQEVKFKLFLDAALSDGAEMIATGHYARLTPEGRLLAGIDSNKDQSYFLYRVTQQSFARSLMPIGEYEKSTVRDLARKYGLATADKKDSQGICFVGKVGIKEFLLAELGQQPEGNIIDQHGAVIGRHDGALFYTIGQRHGLKVGGGLPYYVAGKDMDKNEVYVTSDIDDDRLWRRELKLVQMHWIGDEPRLDNLMVRTRYRAPLVGVEKLLQDSDGSWRARLSEDVRAVTPGQSAVFYHEDECLGGGIVV